MSIKRDKSLGYVINHLSRLMTQTLGDELKSSGVTPGQFPVLMCLWEQDGLTQRELYERVNIEQATMSNTLARMERDSLVKRLPDPADRRASRVHLTSYAKKLEPTLTNAAKAANKKALGALKKKDKKALMETMETLIDNLEAKADSAAP